VPTHKRTVLLSDSESRARILLEKLTFAIKNRSEGSNSTSTHPHESFPGIPHYLANQLLSQRSSMSYHNQYTEKRQQKSNNNIDEIYNISANDDQCIQRVRSTTLVKKMSLLSAEIAVSVDK